ncbi:hypothetical protein CONLIGDRAFT_685854 [Coniochaeta ligniaria NRRL 30616]|uniref:Uncharacterized protein n=1 Tax=Coniochaeta ligniaria NRRL 30616 TaxID=1408157 RepID=A0A1J7I9B4_9PEZI|nr:hypothetical protein CONLIGDRAFT_685854 [Coniochaeta ligniaria NRRL 30616]
MLADDCFQLNVYATIATLNDANVQVYLQRLPTNTLSGVGSPVLDRDLACGDVVARGCQSAGCSEHVDQNEMAIIRVSRPTRDQIHERARGHHLWHQRQDLSLQDEHAHGVRLTGAQHRAYVGMNHIFLYSLELKKIELSCKMVLLKDQDHALPPQANQSHHRAASGGVRARQTVFEIGVETAASAGQSASFALKKVRQHDVRKGMVVLSKIEGAPLPKHRFGTPTDTGLSPISGRCLINVSSCSAPGTAQEQGLLPAFRNDTTKPPSPSVKDDTPKTSKAKTGISSEHEL